MAHVLGTCSKKDPVKGGDYNHMRKLPKIITREEYEKLLKAAKRKELKLAMMLGFEAGMRISEIVGLKGKDGYWRVHPLTQDRVEAASIFISQGKGQKDRVVPRPKRMNENAKKLLPLKTSRRTLQRNVTELGKRVLGKHITFHMLRHGFATHLLDQGRPVHEVQMLGGWARLDTVGIYLHANPKKAIDAAREVF
jgi:integrase